MIEREPLGALAPGPGEVLVRHEAVGLNFIDTYHRSGLYPLPPALGPRQRGGRHGRGGGRGRGLRGGRPGRLFAGAARRLCDAPDRSPPTGWCGCPTAIGAETAAAAMLKGCTAEFLIERCARVQAGEWVLVHAAAGGVGSILVPG